MANELPSSFEKTPVSKAIDTMGGNKDVIKTLQYVFGTETSRVVDDLDLKKAIEPGVQTVIHNSIVQFYGIRVASNDGKFVPAAEERLSA